MQLASSPEYTAEIFDDYIKSSGAGWLHTTTGMRMGCIWSLAVIQDRRFSVAKKFLDRMTNDRTLAFYNQGSDGRKVQSTGFVIVRILSIM
jgi:hypothetical protein